MSELCISRTSEIVVHITRWIIDATDAVVHVARRQPIGKKDGHSSSSSSSSRQQRKKDQVQKELEEEGWVLESKAPCCSKHRTALHCTAPQNTARKIALHCTTLHCTALHCTARKTALHGKLHCIYCSAYSAQHTRKTSNCSEAPASSYL